MLEAETYMFLDCARAQSLAHRSLKIFKQWQQLHRENRLEYIFLTQEYSKLKLRQLKVVSKSTRYFLSKQ